MSDRQRQGPVRGGKKGEVSAPLALCSVEIYPGCVVGCLGERSVALRVHNQQLYGIIARGARCVAFLGCYKGVTAAGRYLLGRCVAAILW